MSSQWISADAIFDGAAFLKGKALRIENNQVQQIAATPADKAVHHISGCLAAGFFDIQVNGGGGVMVNNAPTPDGLRQVARAHRQFGTTSILPTVITDAPNVLHSAVEAVLALNHPQQGVEGLHIEGPHLATSRRGTHDPQFIHPLDHQTLNLVRRLRDAGWPVLITVAPEASTPSQIGSLREMGAVISLGHSAASYQETQSALKAGATCFTHLFNAMPPMENRQPGIVGAAIGSNAWCGIIADGIHVHPEMLRLACRARPLRDRMIAVSDAMSTVGGPDQFELYGQIIRLENDRLVNAEGSLAGAHVTLGQSLINLINFGLDPAEAMAMCRANPAALMGLTPTLDGLPDKDIILLDSSHSVRAIGLSEILQQGDQEKVTT